MHSPLAEMCIRKINQCNAEVSSFSSTSLCVSSFFPLSFFFILLYFLFCDIEVLRKGWGSPPPPLVSMCVIEIRRKIFTPSELGVILPPFWILHQRYRGSPHVLRWWNNRGSVSCKIVLVPLWWPAPPPPLLRQMTVCLCLNIDTASNFSFTYQRGQRKLCQKGKRRMMRRRNRRCLRAD